VPRQGLAQIQLPPGGLLQQSVQLLADRAQPQPVEHRVQLLHEPLDIGRLGGSEANRGRRWRLLSGPRHQPTSAAAAA
jgi:hypothetical protein